MKVALGLLLAAICVAGNPNLKLSGCPGKNPIINIAKLFDQHGNGPLNTNSALEVHYQPRKNTAGHGNFDMNVKIHLKKYIFVDYVEVPTSIMNFFGKMMSQPGVIEYQGNGNFRHLCPFKAITGSCLPNSYTIRVHPLRQYLQKMKQNIGAFANGWYQLAFEAKTSWGETAFCFNLEYNISV